MTKYVLLIFALGVSAFSGGIHLRSRYQKGEVTLRLDNGRECTTPVANSSRPSCYIDDLPEGTYHGRIYIAGRPAVAAPAVTIVVPHDAWAWCRVSADGTIEPEDACTVDK